MHNVLVQYPDWETELAPRLILGVWTPQFVKPAKRMFPQCRLGYIGATSFVQSFFDDCDAFSLPFVFLVTWEGRRCEHFKLKIRPIANEVGFLLLTDLQESARRRERTCLFGRSIRLSRWWRCADQILISLCCGMCLRDFLCSTCRPSECK